MSAPPPIDPASLSFWTERLIAQFDSVIWFLLTVALPFAGRRIAKISFLVRYSLKMRLVVALGIVVIPSAVGLALGANKFAMFIAVVIGFFLMVQWLLRDLSKVGITNAFGTTKQGVSAEASLKEIQEELLFLGIGAKKLTDSAEFEEMLKRCRKKGGKVRFLLSHPENAALEQVAKQNDKDDLSYRSRVKESIREIFTQASRVGVDFEVRVYDLKQRIALPHFRLMFIDDRLCVFSQVFWSKGEGLDNPQLILKKDKQAVEGSLFWGYRKYFEDLWNHEDTKTVTQGDLDGWAV